MPKGFRFLAPCLALALALAGEPRPAPAQQGLLKNRKYQVRVALEKGGRQYAFKCSGAYRVYAGKETLAPGKTYMVDIIRGKVGGKTFRLVFHSLPEDQEERAFELASAVEKLYKLPIKVARAPGKGGGATRLLVTAGEFASQSEANLKAKKLKPSEKLEVYEETLKGIQGRITLRDMQGKTIAADNDSIKLAPMDTEGAHFRVARVAEPKRWKQTQIDSARPYRGQVEFAAAPDGTLMAINHIWLEHYLYGVVAAEMGDLAPLEALKAQAVVARSEIIGKIERSKGANPLYDFSLTGYDHAYGGKQKETPRVKAAVDATVGEILIYQGEAIEAFYSDNCGGMRAGVGEIWGGKEVACLRGGPDRLRDPGPHDLSSDSAARAWTRKAVPSFCGPQSGVDYPAYAGRNFRWVITLKGSALSESATSYGGTGKVKDVSVARRSRSGRVDRLRIVGDRKTITIDRDLDIRRALGGLKSSFITFDVVPDKTGHVASMVIYGAGHGHGVGMCQTGAIMMSKQNYPYRQILGHYFQSVLIRRLYA